MGFPRSNPLRDCIAVVTALAAAPAMAATDVALAGLSQGRAVVVIDGGSPRMLGVGARMAGVKLLAIEDGAAVFEIDGRKQRLVLGDHAVASGRSGGADVLTLIADGRGQFFTQGSVNGAAMRFMVDTGATFVVLDANGAARAGIDFRGKGQPGSMATANGVVRAWLVPGNTVRLGEITLHAVDAAVTEAGLPFGLLGMSVLNRLEMKRDGDTMTLKKRY